MEWAADQVVQGTVAGRRMLPAQVLLGVLTRESNLQQASMHVIQGQTANPLSSLNWYGSWIDGETVGIGLVNWSASDCGYGTPAEPPVVIEVTVHDDGSAAPWHAARFPRP